MAKLDEGIGKICNDTFRPAIGQRRNPFEKWSYLGNAHSARGLLQAEIRLSGLPQRVGSLNSARALRCAIFRRSISLIGARSIHAVAGSIGSYG